MYDPLIWQAGADVKGMSGSTPLEVALAYDLTDALKPLLDAGADPNVQNEVSFMFYQCIFQSHRGWLFIHVALNN